MSDAIWLLPLPLGVSAFVKGGSIESRAFMRCACREECSRRPLGLFLFDHQLYAKAETDIETVSAFAAAGSRALTMVKEALWLSHLRVRYFPLQDDPGSRAEICDFRRSREI